MPYESLKELFYKDSTSNRSANVDLRLKARFEAESTFRTSIATPSGELFLAVPRELSLLNEKVLRYERKIATGMRLLPPVAQWAMIRDLVITEVVSTNELEGVYSTRRQINEILQSDGPFESSWARQRCGGLGELCRGRHEQEGWRPPETTDKRKR